ncbi:unnamed protein product [Allacma fusca]|uniref:Uncharacterized protein n=1 Tax=Allacma fusca TaxID=39272 RepID=A0A8J2LSE9_9HEXA|nr:unnamed protein product [Allacma fusca]
MSKRWEEGGERMLGLVCQRAWVCLCLMIREAEGPQHSEKSQSLSLRWEMCVQFPLGFIIQTALSCQSELPFTGAWRGRRMAEDLGRVAEEGMLEVEKETGSVGMGRQVMHYQEVDGARGDYVALLLDRVIGLEAEDRSDGDKWMGVRTRGYSWRVSVRLSVLADDNVERMMNRHGMALSWESIPHIRCFVGNP